ncbi:hypothetical protein K1719_033727 [Acacia pycnantha]|nr:hypothetical protein K1719_033727 [Acacia pycnantha]
MQKLLRPSSSAPIICTVGSPSLSLCLPTGIHNLAFQNPKFFHSVGASSAFLSHSPSRLPTMSAFTSSRSSLATSPISKKPFTTSSALSSRYLATLAASSSSCCTAINHRALSRAWVVVKYGRGGPRTAWLHSGSDGSSFSASAQATSNSDNCAAGDSGEEGKSTASLPSSEEKPSKLNKRLKGSSSSSCDISSNPDLLTIPGVGPRNLRKLVEKGFAGVAELKQLYKDKFSGKPSDKMVEYLQSSVGIIHKNHAESISTFIKKSVDEESEDNSSVLSPLKDRITFCVEGNISVGKTTFLQRIANETIELRDLVEVVPEPIDKWQNVGPDHFNILDAFYAEPQRYAYTFQNYVFVTRVMQERESSGESSLFG